MRIALISDLHGNEVALSAVLADIARVGADRIVCLGDVATLGPSPEAVLEILRSSGCACIEGNHDAFLLHPELIHTYTEAPVVMDAVDWCRSRLSTAHLAYLKTFQSTLEISLEAGATLFLYHGSPRSHMQDILATTPAGALDGFLEGHAATVMAGGHTHLQMLRQHRGILLVNPGSVGMPFKESAGGQAPTVLPHAEYAVVESTAAGIGIHLYRVPVDKAALRRAIAATDNPIRAFLLQEYA